MLQAFTQKETASVTSPLGRRDAVVEPFGSYTVGRVHKDWDKGNTSLGGMLTSTHRWVDDPAARLPADPGAPRAAIDFTRYFADRAWVLEASGVVSRVTGDPAAILALQTNAVHYYQRPDASHLGVDPNATSLSGHGGSVRFGRSDTSRLRLIDHFHWYSPGLDLNDVGYLRQADLIANQVFLGWSETTPKGIFRNYSVQLAREDQWDFGGLETRSRDGARGLRPVQEQVAAPRRASPTRTWWTRACSGAAPRCAGTTTTRRALRAAATTSRRVSAHAHGELLLGARRRLAGLELGRGP